MIPARVPSDRFVRHSFRSNSAGELGITGLSYPPQGFDKTLAREHDHAEEMAKRPQPKLSFKRRFLDFVEGPWAPPWHLLPDKRSPELSGNTSLPFREPNQSPESLAYQARRLAQVRGSERRTKISSWSTVLEYDVPIPNLPSEFDGLSILHLTDIHFSKRSPRSAIELSILEKWLHASSKRIDLCAISGDILTTSPEDLYKMSLFALRRIVEIATESFFVYGNHDFHGHTPAFVSRELERFKCFDVNNQKFRVRIGGASINFVGVDDAYFGAPKAPEYLHPNEVNIVITHNLDAIRSNFPRSVDLVLSGHTHCGEIWGMDGTKAMGFWGYCDNKNGHTRYWDSLSHRTLSFVGPGYARYYAPSWWMEPPGPAIITLRRVDTERAPAILDTAYDLQGVMQLAS